MPSGLSTALSKSKNASAAKVTFSLTGAAGQRAAASRRGRRRGGRRRRGRRRGGGGGGARLQGAVAAASAVAGRPEGIAPAQFVGAVLPDGAIGVAPVVVTDLALRERAGQAGRQSAADAKSTATLFSFFMILLSRKAAVSLRYVQIGSEKTWQTPGLASAHHRRLIVPRDVLRRMHLDAPRPACDRVDVARVLQPAALRIAAPFPVAHLRLKFALARRLTRPPMTQFAKETLPVSLEEEMRRSYLDYAMSVIVGRALPDARDGLKPVHRRVLFAMHELNNDWNRPYKKSARIVGDVIGKYHPHGDTAVYDTIVRMAQDFSLRYMLVDGQGNFGSVDGDNAAAMRYTEIRLAKIAHEMLADIDKETVDFGPNYDGTEKEPLVLPTPAAQPAGQRLGRHRGGHGHQHPAAQPQRGGRRLPAPAEQRREATIEELMEIMPAPDFPTAGIIYGVDGVREGYRTGRGRVIMRAQAATSRTSARASARRSSSTSCPTR